VTPAATAEHFDDRAFFDRVEGEATRISAEVFPSSDVAEMERAFEQSARQALRAPAFAERSVLIRRAAKRLLPRRLVPVAKRSVARFDALSKRVIDALSGGRGRH
jgi:hypothetical protein